MDSAGAEKLMGGVYFPSEEFFKQGREHDTVHREGLLFRFIPRAKSRKGACSYDIVDSVPIGIAANRFPSTVILRRGLDHWPARPKVHPLPASWTLWYGFP
jgi:hypothetical protein